MRYRPALLLVTLGLILLSSAPCGKKGPPFLPQRVMPLRVTELKAEREKGGVFLRGRVVGPKGKSRETAEVEGCQVYHARYSISGAPCEGCPIEYGDPKVIKGELITGEGFQCQVPGIERGGIHFFQVLLIGRDGAVSAPSERAKLIIGD